MTAEVQRPTPPLPSRLTGVPSQQPSGLIPEATDSGPTPSLTEEELAAGCVPIPERPSMAILLQGSEFRPDLTDDELEQIVAYANEQGVITCNDALMLIADLHASRARVKELEDGIEAFLSGRNPL